MPPCRSTCAAAITATARANATAGSTSQRAPPVNALSDQRRADRDHRPGGEPPVDTREPRARHREQERPGDDGRREREPAEQPSIGARAPLLPDGPAQPQPDQRGDARRRSASDPRPTPNPQAPRCPAWPAACRAIPAATSTTTTPRTIRQDERQQVDRRAARALLRHQQQDRQVEHDPDPREDREPHERDAKQDRIDAEMVRQAAADAADQAPASCADEAGAPAAAAAQGCRSQAWTSLTSRSIARSVVVLCMRAVSSRSCARAIGNVPNSPPIVR